MSDKQLKYDGNTVVRRITTLLALVALTAAALPAAEARSGAQASVVEPPPRHSTVQRCMSLSQAVESIRRRGNVERVISAETRGNTHYIKVLTKDGKVRTHQVPAC